MRVHLIEPHAGGRISGGYLYNQRIAAGAPGVARHAVRLECLQLDCAALELSGPAWVLADSLFLTPELLPLLLGLARPGLAFGVLLHAFPSFIRRGSDRKALAHVLPLTPLPEELELLDRLELCVAPGPYVPRVLASAGCPIRTVMCAPGVDRPAPLPGPGAKRPGSAGPVRLISMGGVSPLKGLDDALDALIAVPGGAWEWTIVGDLGVAPEHAASLERRARDSGLGARVQLIGQRDHSQALALLGQSDALLVSSYTENTPLVALEALALGVPIVGYAVGGVPDLVADGEAGLLAPLLDVSGLAARLDRVIGDPIERARLARGAARAGQGLWGWDAAARHFASALTSEFTRRESGPRDPAGTPPAGA